MRNRQLGVSLSGLIITSFFLILLALLGLKVGPSYIEFFAIKKAVNAIGTEGRSSVAEIRKAFDQRATVDDITTIRGSDLDVGKEGGAFVITAAYRKEIRLFANIGLYIDFSASSTGGG